MGSGRRGLVVMMMLVAGAMAGCSSKSAPSPAAATGGPSVAKVGKVVVTVSDAVANEREQRFTKAGGTEGLAAAITQELTRTGRLDPSSPEVLQVTVTSYRMRSGAAVYFGGFASGADTMEVQVSVTDGSTTVKQYKTDASGILGGLDQQSRFDRIAKAVAERVVAQL